MRSIFATVAECKAISGANIPPYQSCTIVQLGQSGLGVASIGRAEFIWVPGSVSTDATEQAVIAPTTSPASGKWHRADPVFDLKLPYAFNTANDTVLFTVPAGFSLQVLRPLNEVTVAYGGSDAGVLGIDTSTTLAAGDLLATSGLSGTGFQVGTVGAALTEAAVLRLAAGVTIRHNLIVAGLTSGAGFWHVPVMQLSL